MENLIKILTIKVLNIFGLKKWANATLTMRSENQKIKIPVIDGIGLQHFYQGEVWMGNLLKKIPGKEGIFIDVGANLGQTLKMYKLHHPEGKYIGFEPNEVCVLYLRTFVQKNQWKNVHIIPKALSSTVGESKLKFYGKQPTDASATILDDFRPGNKIWNEITIETTNWEGIDDSLQKHFCDGIKIDVEGSEKEVLEVLQHKIKADLPYIIIEILPVYSKINKTRLQRQEALETLINEWEYRMFRIKGTREGDLTLLPVEKIGIHNNMVDVNYLMVHLSRVKELQSLFPML